MKYAKGICWTDDCRIPYLNGVEGEFSESYLRSGVSKSNGSDLILNISGNKRDGVYVNQQGRFTPSLLVCDDMLNDGNVSKSGGRTISKTENTNIKNNVYNVGWVRTGSDVKDSGSSSRYYDLDKWFDKVIDNL